jgi:type IV fimbrial biogenesis protein FimT
MHHVLLSAAPRLSHSGFTLYELMITLAIAGMLMVPAAGFARLIMNQRLVTDTNRLFTDIQLARSEAVKRGTAVTLCKSRNARDCERGSAWHEGWIVFADDNGNRRLDADEALLRAQSALDPTLRLNFNGALNHDHYLTWHGLGHIEPNGTFAVCDATQQARGRLLVISTAGRARVANDKTAGSRCRG